MPADGNSTPRRCSRAANLYTPTHTFRFLRKAGGANPQSGRLITQETSSPPSSARDAAAIGGAREGLPRQARIFRIAAGGLIAARILMPPAHFGHSRTSTANTDPKSPPRD